MSFVLHFFHAPQVDSVESATEYVYELCDDDPPLADRFRKFVELVTTVYPDLSADDDDGDDERNLWPEGLDSEWGDEPVVNVGIKTDAVEEGVLSIVASKAVQAGLQMLDPQNAMLYRSDHVVVHHDGSTAPFRMLTPFAAKLMKPADDGLDPRKVRDAIGAGLYDRLAPEHGFTLSSVKAYTIVHRQRGAIRQAIAIEAKPDRDQVKIKLEIWLSTPRIEAVWMAGLPRRFTDWKVAEDARCGGSTYDFVYGLTDIVPSATAQEIAQVGKLTLRSTAPIDEFAAMVGTFIEHKLLPVIDPINDLDALAALALTDDALDIVRTGQVRVLEQLATAVLTRLAKPAWFEAVARGLIGNPNKSGYWGEFGDREGRHLDQLIEYLRALRMP